MTITRALTVGLALAAALLLAACGEDEDESGEATGVAPPAAAGVAAIESIGGTDVLVDSDGRALYSAEQEAGGEILCTGACTSIWDPVLASAGEAAATDAAQLDVVERPDGDQQLALEGRPLYTFTEESPGQLTGDGFVDEFEGTEFEWMAATVGGDSASSAPPDDGSSSIPGY